MLERIKMISRGTVIVPENDFPCSMVMAHDIFQEFEKKPGLWDATRFTKSCATGLSLYFLSEMEKPIQSIKDSPESWPTIGGKGKLHIPGEE